MKRLIMHKLIEWKKAKKKKPLLLMGVRQVGKTYLLQEFGAKHFPRCHYLNFEKEMRLSKIFEEDLNPKRILDDLRFYLDHPIDPQKDLIIFDEIQACPKALTSLKYFQEELPEAFVCGAGSLLGVHLAPTSFPVGKVTLLPLRPMSFEEFLMAIEDQKALKALQSYKISHIAHEHLWNRLKHYFIVGGMPEAVTTFCIHQEEVFTAFSKVRKKQEDLVTGYYSDIAKHSGKVNAMHIDRVFRSIPAQLEKEHDGSSGKFKFKGVIPGVSHYARFAGAIDWLVATGLAIKVNIVNSGLLPFHGHTKENIFKLMLFDIGILGLMSHLSPQVIMDYAYGSYKGYFAENFVAQEFLFAQSQELHCWNEKSAEIEFLREIEGKVIPVEVKAGKSTKAKSLKVFADKYRPPFTVIMSGQPLHIDHEKKKHFYPLYLAGFFPLGSSD